MSMYFRCYGYLSFESEAVARKNYDVLTTCNDTLFYFFPNELQIVRQTIKFKTLGNFSAYSTCERTDDLIRKVAANVVRGEIKIDEGDGEDALWSWKYYSVFDKQVYREHTNPQKSYKFKGELEFADKETAKVAGKMLLTDTANSIFTKFPLYQKVFADDKRLINFVGKILHIDAHCAGNKAIFKKTTRLLRQLKAQSIGGNVELAETHVLRFIPDKNKDSSGWVNNMNRDIFYRFSGSVLYHTPAEAVAACEKLLSDERSVFSITSKSSFPLYIANKNRLIFNDINGCHRKLLNSTDDIIREVIEFAKTGKVECAFSNVETMDSYVVDRNTPAKVRKSNALSAKLVVCKSNYLIFATENTENTEFT
jgi:hypothetical protein